MKETTSLEKLRIALSRLTGKAPLDYIELSQEDHLIEALAPTNSKKIGYNQFNELLLIHGLERINKPLFDFLFKKETDSDDKKKSINNLDELNKGVDKFRKLALLAFGNLRYAYKILSGDEEELSYWVEALSRDLTIDMKTREAPIERIKQIDKIDTFYTGYLVKRELTQRLKEDSNDEQAKNELAKLDEVVETAKRNQHLYLTSDHMDVYVATSMRSKHEFILVNDVINKVFSDKSLTDLNLRWFDPTQAYTDKRIDKGLSEALMLKRAECTLYLAQENDTLGKDSELASTLAQGKPVIAYVPDVDDEYFVEYFDMLKETYPEKTEKSIILEQLQIISPSLAWEDKTVQEWIKNPKSIDIVEGKKFLQEIIKLHYDKRAKTFSEVHPLGIQVNLETGVAVGVLVARTIKQCCDLIKNIFTNKLDFTVTEDGDYLYLKETITGCTFRISSGDKILTNSFWNFYL